MNLSFRGLLVAFRKSYREDSKKYFTYAGVVAFILALSGLALDYFTPFEEWFMLARSLLLVPTAVSFFAIAYGIGLRLHFRRAELDPDWVPYRARFSPKTRIQISIVVSALIFVFIVSTGKSVGYTLFSSLLAVAILAVLAFIRPTSEEQRRTELGVPDARDLTFDLNKRALERERLIREKAKKAKKEKNR